MLTVRADHIWKIAALLGITLVLVVLAGANATGAFAGEFGIAGFDQQITAGPSGETFTQGGGHPYEIVTEIEYNHHSAASPFPPEAPLPNADTKDIITDLPPGLVGDPTGVGQCTAAQLIGIKVLAPKQPECPISSVVGLIHLQTDLNWFVLGNFTFPVYNMVPPPDEPATFGFNVYGVPITFYGNVRNGGDHGVRIVSPDIPTTVPVSGFTLTLWGNPADPSHDAQRCDYGRFGIDEIGYFTNEPDPKCPGVPGTPEGPNADPEQPTAFITLPGSCGAPDEGFETTLKIDSWLEPGVFKEQSIFNHVPPGFPLPPAEWGPQQGLIGCDREPFAPSISVEPTNHQADTPTGLNIEVSVPQDGLLNPEGIATANLKKAVVALPAGESVSPSAADGLGGCTLDEIGLDNGQPAACPGSSKLGTVAIETPLLNEPLTGAIYLGQPECGPCGVADDLAGRMVKLYIVVEGHGVILKLPGRVELDPATGRIVTTFDNNPQLPFSHLKLNFKAGPRSPLVNPHTCGTYETSATFTPWSGNPPVQTTSAFQITSGPGGGACPTGTAQAFAPGFAAGTTSNQAGGFSPLAVAFSRNDGEQQLGGVTVRTPPGLLGMLSNVSLCGEPQASEGSCPASSEIGSLTVAAGAGANPFYVTGGKVFITTGYKGGEFGLSVVVPAQAGPFNLGTVIVRGSISVDPVTTALTVTTDPLPTILDGIPLDLRSVHVNIDKDRFIFNPTDCNPLSLTGLLTGGLAGFEEASENFQVTNCGRLGFKPQFSVSTPGKTSRANGAGLTAVLTYPTGPQANIAKVKVNLPKQLPSRLTTLQKACADAVFHTNPDNCPPASKIGTARAITPILPEPLTGPVYFVSHGGEAFPDLVVALKGYGINFDLVGTTFISKAGITSTTFKQVPDVPVGSFELTLPQGPNSALAANGNLCTSHLVMPTIFVAQDGAEIHQNTPITTTGCPRHKARKAHRASRHDKHKHKKK